MIGSLADLLCGSAEPIKRTERADYSVRGPRIVAGVCAANRRGGMMAHYHDDAQWFSPLGKCCCGCGKPATGTLRGYRNDDRGPYTEKCAERAIKAAHKLGGRMPDWVMRDTKGRPGDQ